MKIFFLSIVLMGSTSFAGSQISHSCWTKIAPVTTRINYSVFVNNTGSSDLFRIWVHQNTAKVGKTWVADLSATQLGQLETSNRFEVELQRVVRNIRRPESRATLTMTKNQGTWTEGSISFEGLEGPLNFELNCSPMD